METGIIERKSNFELLRIISILFIILSHFINHGILEFDSPFIQNQIFYYLFDSIGYVGVAIFFMISGYFNYSLEHKPKILKTIFITFFYGLLIGFCCLILTLTGVLNFSLKTILAYLISPNFSEKWWFITIYILLLLLAPGLKELIKNANAKQILILIFIVLVVLYGFDGYILKTNQSLYRGIYYFLIGMVISKYNILNVLHKKYLFLFISLACFLLLNSWMLIPESFPLFLIDAYRGFCILILCSLFAFSIFVFVGKIEFSSKFINFLSSPTIDIYLLHDNALRFLLWQELFHVDDLYKNSRFFIIIGLGICLGIYILCFSVGKIREWFFKKIKVNKFFIF